ncbi:MAG: aminodeoxychorismate synthase component I [Eubacteriales bacterium]
MKIQEINAPLDSFELFTLFKDDFYSFFLDSGRDHQNMGRYSFIGSNPFMIFSSKDNVVKIEEQGKEKVSRGNPFHMLRELLNQYKFHYDTPFPFIGGAVGFFSYDLCHHIEKLPRTAIDDTNIPDCYLGFYDGIIIIDHLKSKCFISALGIKEKEDIVIKRIVDRIETRNVMNIKLSQGENRHLVFEGNFTKEKYMDALDRIHQYIQDGDIYQTNLTQRFQCDLQIAPIELYHNLRSINPAPFASYIDFGEGQIVSSSPERFLKISDRKIETRPIKGTMPRGKTKEEDEKYRNELINSEKDKAELLMIVDLERNDLGKISKPGTIEVPELFKLEEYETVFHLVSTVTGELKDDVDVVDCITATFPGGSITGAPKIRAMEIIDEVEPTQRNIYTGSIGYIGYNGDLDLNIVIRTIVCKDSKGYFGVGGGIVWDSDNQLEYEETFHKGKALMEALKRTDEG